MTALPRRAWVEQVMGIPVSIHLRGAGVDTPEAADAVAAAFSSLRAMDRVFSTWREDSEVMRLRRGDLTIERCHPLVAEALEIGGVATRVTGGAFTMLLPGDAGDLVLDPTGLVKGWAVERAAALLADLPGVSACVNGAGDLAVVAHADLPDEGPDAITWRIGIEDPRDPTRTADVVALTRGAVATSGTAARGAHLYDPAGRRMVGRPGSTTVHGPSLLWADIWATALFVGGESAGAAFTSRAPAYTRIEL
ncbi:MAG: FAD:protein FMN transferase [Nocardioides sp.]